MTAELFHPGARVDRFVLGERIARAVRATFWRVAGEADGLPLVMKVPRLDQPDNPTAAVGFEVEQQVLAHLRGPHAPRLVAAGDFAGQPYLVMEYVPGASLHDRMASLAGAADEIAEVGARIADALADLHRQRVLHLDLQPHNLLFRRSGEAVLVNFGLANALDRPDLLGEAFRFPLGSGPYIAPEQVLLHRDDPRSDLFALGVVLYQLTTSVRPFGSPGTVPGLRRRLFHEPDPPRALDPSCPGWLQEVILHCLETDPGRRYASAEQVADDLRNPERVELTERARRGRRPGPLGRLWRSLRTTVAVARGRGAVAGRAAEPRSGRLVMVAVNLEPGSEELARALLVAVRRLLAVDQQARLMCVSVRGVARQGPAAAPGGEAAGSSARRLVELRHWARTLWLPPERVTFQVLEGEDPAQTLLDHIRANRVERLILGARGHSSLRRFLGSVSSRLVAEADCTVTVVRVFDPNRAAAETDGDEAEPQELEMPTGDERFDD